ncbi:hypothetical protein Acsp07_50360 [Actinomycetospora sp. NBRC 106378]|nr:hypothetical protein Acsp07_50360 [Actinomycetospora sp. NBRC 106378]
MFRGNARRAGASLVVRSTGPPTAGERVEPRVGPGRRLGVVDPDLSRQALLVAVDEDEDEVPLDEDPDEPPEDPDVPDDEDVLEDDDPESDEDDDEFDDDELPESDDADDDPESDEPEVLEVEPDRLSFR